MAEESDLERTEPPSQRRLERAREEGQVARSVELSTFAVMLAGAAALWLSGGELARRLQGLVHHALAFDRASAFDPATLAAALQFQAVEALLAFLPFGLIVFVAALASPLLLNGWLFSPQALQPDFSRLDPANGFGRMFSWQSAMEVVKSLAKAGLLGVAGCWAAWSVMGDLLRLPLEPMARALSHSGSLLAVCFAALLAAMLVIVAIDVPWQLWSYYRRLRMTRDEMRREMKESEGDPHVKARIRSLQREAARRRMMAQVPKADVVITNPSHYAVALRYRAGEMPAPQVVAKGMNLIAARIRELGVEHRIPVVEAPPLARALYRHAELERDIPAGLYSAVAEVLAYVYQLAHWRARGGARPAPLDDVAVPPELDPGAQPA